MVGAGSGMNTPAVWSFHGNNNASYVNTKTTAVWSSSDFNDIYSQSMILVDNTKHMTNTFSRATTAGKLRSSRTLGRSTGPPICEWNTATSYITNIAPVWNSLLNNYRLSDGTVSVPVSMDLIKAGGNLPFFKAVDSNIATSIAGTVTYSITGGIDANNPMLTIDPSTGDIIGKPNNNNANLTIGDVYNFTITATDGRGSSTVPLKVSLKLIGDPMYFSNGTETCPPGFTTRSIASRACYQRMPIGVKFVPDTHHYWQVGITSVKETTRKVYRGANGQIYAAAFLQLHSYTQAIYDSYTIFKIVPPANKITGYVSIAISDLSYYVSLGDGSYCGVNVVCIVPVTSMASSGEYPWRASFTIKRVSLTVGSTSYSGYQFTNSGAECPRCMLGVEPITHTVKLYTDVEGSNSPWTIFQINGAVGTTSELGPYALPIPTQFMNADEAEQACKASGLST